MDKQKVDLYLMMNQKYFPAERIMFLRERLLQMDDDTFMRKMCIRDRSYAVHMGNRLPPKKSIALYSTWIII